MLIKNFPSKSCMFKQTRKAPFIKSKMNYASALFCMYCITNMLNALLESINLACYITDECIALWGQPNEPNKQCHNYVHFI